MMYLRLLRFHAVPRGFRIESETGLANRLRPYLAYARSMLQFFTKLTSLLTLLQSDFLVRGSRFSA